MGFSFRLESVMNYRQRIVDQQGKRVAEARRRVSVIQERLDALVRDLNDQMRDPSHDGRGELRVQDLLAKAAWLEHLGQKREALTEDLRGAQQVLAGEQENLNEAWKDLEILEQLRKRQKTAWLTEQDRQEGKDLDEIGQIRADQARRSILALKEEQLS